MDVNVAAFPWGQKQMSRDFRGDVAVFYCYGAPAAAREGTVHFFYVQKPRCIHEYTVIIATQIKAPVSVKLGNVR